MAWIDQHLEKFIKDCFPERYVYAYHEYRTWQSSRYLYVTTVLKDDKDLHYEYIGGAVELHLEGKYQSTDYKYFAKELRFQTSRNPKLHWLGWQGRNQCRCRIDAATDNWEQLMNAFIEIMGIFDPIIEKIIVAYEPVWAIGTGKVPTNEEIDDIICYIKDLIQDKYGARLLVLYGGSVNAKNIDELNLVESVDGYLIGGASTKPEEFIYIMNKCE